MSLLSTNQSGRQRGLIQIPLMIGLLIISVAIPVATRLVTQNQDIRQKAAGSAPGCPAGTVSERTYGECCGCGKAKEVRECTMGDGSKQYKSSDCGHDAPGCTNGCPQPTSPSQPTSGPGPTSPPSGQTCNTVGQSCADDYSENCGDGGSRICHKRGTCSGVGGGEKCSWGPGSYCDECSDPSAPTIPPYNTPGPTSPPSGGGGGGCGTRGNSCCLTEYVLGKPVYNTCNSGLTCRGGVCIGSYVVKYGCNRVTGGCSEDANGTYTDVNVCQQNCTRLPSGSVTPSAGPTSSPSGSCGQLNGSCCLTEYVMGKPVYNSCNSGLTCSGGRCIAPYVVKYGCNRVTGGCSEDANGTYTDVNTCQQNCVRTVTATPTPTRTVTPTTPPSGSCGQLNGSCCLTEYVMGQPVYNTCSSGLRCSGGKCIKPYEVKYGCNPVTGGCLEDANGTYTDVNTCQQNCVRTVTATPTPISQDCSNGRSNNESWCEGNRLKKCQNGIERVVVNECAYGCVNGACSPQPLPTVTCDGKPEGTSECLSTESSYRNCRQGKWTTYQCADGFYCPSGNSYCTRIPISNTPTPKQNYRCLGNELLYENAVVETCQYGCDSAALKCKEAPSSCTLNGTTYVNGVSRCNEGALTYNICERGVWLNRSCPQGSKCKDNRCQAEPTPSVKVECVNGETRCLSDDMVQSCVGGRWAGGELCDYGCDRGDGKCRGEIVPTSTPTRIPTLRPTNTTAPTPTTVIRPTVVPSVSMDCNGRVNMSSWCEGNRLKKCQNGVERVVVNECAYGCVNGACSPVPVAALTCGGKADGTSECVSGSGGFRKCQSGEWVFYNCASGFYCPSGGSYCTRMAVSSTPTPIIRNSNYKCQGNELLYGNAVVESCRYGCDAVSLTCKEAPSGCSVNNISYSSGASRCSEGESTYSICEGSNWIVRNCPSGMVCSNNRCRSVAIAQSQTETIVKSESSLWCNGNNLMQGSMVVKECVSGCNAAKGDCDVLAIEKVVQPESGTIVYADMACNCEKISTGKWYWRGEGCNPMMRTMECPAGEEEKSYGFFDDWAKENCKEGEVLMYSGSDVSSGAPVCVKPEEVEEINQQREDYGKVALIAMSAGMLAPAGAGVMTTARVGNMMYATVNAFEECNSAAIDGIWSEDERRRCMVAAAYGVSGVLDAGGALKAIGGVTKLGKGLEIGADIIDLSLGSANAVEQCMENGWSWDCAMAVGSAALSGVATGFDIKDMNGVIKTGNNLAGGAADALRPLPDGGGGTGGGAVRLPADGDDVAAAARRAADGVASGELPQGRPIASLVPDGITDPVDDVARLRTRAVELGIEAGDEVTESSLRTAIQRTEDRISALDQRAVEVGVARNAGENADDYARRISQAEVERVRVERQAESVGVETEGRNIDQVKKEVAEAQAKIDELNGQAREIRTYTKRTDETVEQFEQRIGQAQKRIADLQAQGVAPKTADETLSDFERRAQRELALAQQKAAELASLKVEAQKYGINIGGEADVVAARRVVTEAKEQIGEIRVRAQAEGVVDQMAFVDGKSADQLQRELDEAIRVKREVAQAAEAAKREAAEVAAKQAEEARITALKTRGEAVGLKGLSGSEEEIGVMVKRAEDRMAELRIQARAIDGNLEPVAGETAESFAKRIDDRKLALAQEVEVAQKARAEAAERRGLQNEVESKNLGVKMVDEGGSPRNIEEIKREIALAEEKINDLNNQARDIRTYTRRSEETIGQFEERVAAAKREIARLETRGSELGLEIKKGDETLSEFTNRATSRIAEAELRVEEVRKLIADAQVEGLKIDVDSLKSTPEEVKIKIEDARITRQAEIELQIAQVRRESAKYGISVEGMDVEEAKKAVDQAKSQIDEVLARAKSERIDILWSEGRSGASLGAELDEAIRVRNQRNLAQRAKEFAERLLGRPKLTSGRIAVESYEDVVEAVAKGELRVVEDGAAKARIISLGGDIKQADSKAFRLAVPEGANDALKRQIESINKTLDDFEASSGYHVYQEQLELVLSDKAILQLQAGGGKTSVLGPLLAAKERRTVFSLPTSTDATSFVNDVTARIDFFKKQDIEVFFFDNDRGFLKVGDNFDRLTAEVVDSKIIRGVADKKGSGLMIITESSDNAWGVIRGRKNQDEASRLMYEFVMGDRNFSMVVDEVGAVAKGEFSVASGEGVRIADLKDKKSLMGMDSGEELLTASREVEGSETLSRFREEVLGKISKGESSDGLFFEYVDENGVRSVKPFPKDESIIGRSYSDLIDQTIKNTPSEAPIRGELEEIRKALLADTTDEGARRSFEAILKSSRDNPLDQKALADLAYRTADLQARWSILARVPGNDFGIEGMEVVLRKAGGTTGETFSDVVHRVALQTEGAKMMDASGMNTSWVKLTEIDDIVVTADADKISNAEIFRHKAAEGKFKGYDATPDTAANALGVKSSGVSERPRDPTQFVSDSEGTDLIKKATANTDYRLRVEGKAKAFVIADEGVTFQKQTDELIAAHGEVEVVGRTKFITEPNGGQRTEYYIEKVAKGADGKVERVVLSTPSSQDEWSRLVHQSIEQDPKKVMIVYEGRTRAVDFKVNDNNKNIVWTIIANDGNNMEDITQAWKRNRVPARKAELLAAGWSEAEIEQASQYNLWVRTSDTGLNGGNVVDHYQKVLAEELGRERFESTLRQVGSSREKSLLEIKEEILKKSGVNKAEVETVFDGLVADARRAERAQVLEIQTKPLLGEEIPREIYARGQQSFESLKGTVEDLGRRYNLSSSELTGLKKMAGVEGNYLTWGEFESIYKQAARQVDGTNGVGPLAQVRYWAQTNSPETLPKTAWHSRSELDTQLLARTQREAEIAKQTQISAARQVELERAEYERLAGRIAKDNLGIEIKLENGQNKPLEQLREEVEAEEIKRVVVLNVRAKDFDLKRQSGETLGDFEKRIAEAEEAARKVEAEKLAKLVEERKAALEEEARVARQKELEQAERSRIEKDNRYGDEVLVENGEGMGVEEFRKAVAEEREARVRGKSAGLSDEEMRGKKKEQIDELIVEKQRAVEKALKRTIDEAVANFGPDFDVSGSVEEIVARATREAQMIGSLESAALARRLSGVTWNKGESYRQLEEKYQQAIDLEKTKDEAREIYGSNFDISGNRDEILARMSQTQAEIGILVAQAQAEGFEVYWQRGEDEETVRAKISEAKKKKLAEEIKKEEQAASDLGGQIKELKEVSAQLKNLMYSVNDDLLSTLGDRVRVMERSGDEAERIMNARMFRDELRQMVEMMGSGVRSAGRWVDNEAAQLGGLVNRTSRVMEIFENNIRPNRVRLDDEMIYEANYLVRELEKWRFEVETRLRQVTADLIAKQDELRRSGADIRQEQEPIREKEKVETKEEPVVTKEPVRQTEVKEPIREMAVGDVHGDFEQLIKILSGEVKGEFEQGRPEIKIVEKKKGFFGIGKEQLEWIGGNTRLYITGDIFDRVPQGQSGVGTARKIMELQKKAREAGGDIIVLLGNHDAAMIAATRFGNFTLITPGPTAEEAEALRNDTEVLNWVMGLPAMVRSGDVIYMHSDVVRYLSYGRNIEEINTNIRRILNDGEASFVDYQEKGVSKKIKDLVSDMTSRGELNKEGVDKVLAVLGGKRIVHGHSAMREVMDERVINVDMALSGGYRQDENRGLLKEVNIIDESNKQTEEQESSPESKDSWEKLLEDIRGTGGSATEVAKLVVLVRTGDANLSALTGTNGIRDRVFELISRDIPVKSGESTQEYYDRVGQILRARALGMRDNTPLATIEAREDELGRKAKEYGVNLESKKGNSWQSIRKDIAWAEVGGGEEVEINWSDELVNIETEIGRMWVKYDVEARTLGIEGKRPGETLRAFAKRINEATYANSKKARRQVWAEELEFGRRRIEVLVGMISLNGKRGFSTYTGQNLNPEISIKVFDEGETIEKLDQEKFKLAMKLLETEMMYFNDLKNNKMVLDLRGVTSLAEVDQRIMRALDDKPYDSLSEVSRKSLESMGAARLKQLVDEVALEIIEAGEKTATIENLKNRYNFAQKLFEGYYGEYLRYRAEALTSGQPDGLVTKMLETWQEVLGQSDLDKILADLTKDGEKDKAWARVRPEYFQIRERMKRVRYITTEPTGYFYSIEDAISIVKAVLGMDEFTEVSAESVRTPYRRLSRMFHPDATAQDLRAGKVFQLVNEANEVMGKYLRGDYPKGWVGINDLSAIRSYIEQSSSTDPIGGMLSDGSKEIAGIRERVGFNKQFENEIAYTMRVVSSTVISFIKSDTDFTTLKYYLRQEFERWASFEIQQVYKSMSAAEQESVWFALYQALRNRHLGSRAYYAPYGHQKQGCSDCSLVVYQSEQLGAKIDRLVDEGDANGALEQIRTLKNTVDSHEFQNQVVQQGLKAAAEVAEAGIIKNQKEKDDALRALDLARRKVGEVLGSESITLTEDQRWELEDYERQLEKTRGMVEGIQLASIWEGKIGDWSKPKEVLGAIKQDLEMREQLAVKAGVIEGFTVEEHTLMVLGQFERYFAQRELPGGVDKNFFRIVLALHDIGKAKAVAVGDKGKQYEMSVEIISRKMAEWGYGEGEVRLAAALVGSDALGEYIKGRGGYEQALTATGKLAQEAARAGMSLEDFYELKKIYYMADASSYTWDAGSWMGSLNRLFKVNRKKGEINFAKKTADKVNLLDRETGKYFVMADEMGIDRLQEGEGVEEFLERQNRVILESGYFEIEEKKEISREERNILGHVGEWWSNLVWYRLGLGKKGEEMVTVYHYTDLKSAAGVKRDGGLKASVAEMDYSVNVQELIKGKLPGWGRGNVYVTAWGPEMTREYRGAVDTIATAILRLLAPILPVNPSQSFPLGFLGEKRMGAYFKIELPRKYLMTNGFASMTLENALVFRGPQGERDLDFDNEVVKVEGPFLNQRYAGELRGKDMVEEREIPLSFDSQSEKTKEASSPEIIRESREAFEYHDEKQKFDGVDIEHFAYAQNILKDRAMSKEALKAVAKELGVKEDYDEIFWKLAEVGYSKKIIDLINEGRYKYGDEVRYEVVISSQNKSPKVQAVFEAVANSIDALMPEASSIGQFGKGIKQALDWLEANGEDRVDVYSKTETGRGLHLAVLRDKKGQLYIDLGLAEEEVEVGTEVKISVGKGIPKLIAEATADQTVSQEEIAEGIHKRFPFVAAVQIETKVSGGDWWRVNGYENKLMVVPETGIQSHQGSGERKVWVELDGNSISIRDNGRGMDEAVLARMFVPKRGTKHPEPISGEGMIDAELGKVKLVYDETLQRRISFARNGEVVVAIDVPKDLASEAGVKGGMMIEGGGVV